jgi:hypothetical protein
VKQADIRNIFKKAPRSVCTSTIVISFDPWSPVSPTSSSLKTQTTQKRTHMTLNKYMKEISKWNSD